MNNEMYSWKVHLIRKSGWKSVLMFPALLVAGLWGLYLGGVCLLVLAVLLLILTLRDFLFPIHYKITPNGVLMKGLFLKGIVRWEEVEEITRENGLLRLRLGKSSGSRFPRWFVVYLAGDEEEIWKKIESWRKNFSAG